MVSHTHLASLNARESRVPVMVALGNATSLLRDGQMVMVHGAAESVTEVLYCPDQSSQVWVAFAPPTSRGCIVVAQKNAGQHRYLEVMIERVDR
jgi:hypothetical protein